MQKIETALTQAILKGREIAPEHPYKIVGKPDTYNQYNEAWQDCADRYEQLLISLLQKEREDIEEAYLNGTQEPLSSQLANRQIRSLVDYFTQTFSQYNTKEHE